eukprot:maker-scaffold197_size267318-snap-gene-1.34 protein:Tk09463 transcript:maker-scaffold197_size267318-snap-gene-1.34-mRNA-1 annotation:"complement component c1q receptor"
MSLGLSGMFTLSLVILLELLGDWTCLVSGTPVRGIRVCLNHEDCIGAHRYCHRNKTMNDGLCACEYGYKLASDSNVKCLNLYTGECETDLDCPTNSRCERPLGFGSRVPPDWNKYTPNLPLKCMGVDEFPYGMDMEPRTGGGLRPGSDFLDHYYTFGRRNRIHTGFHPQYIKFVEDAMLVLFLFCVMVTLLVVHRASCYRQFRNSRRNGPLRYIIPHRDDQPPPYSQYGDRRDRGTCSHAGPDGVDGRRSHPNGRVKTSASGRHRGETPPPTYDEALLISQVSNTPVPLYIALPESPEIGAGASPSPRSETVLEPRVVEALDNDGPTTVEDRAQAQPLLLSSTSSRDSLPGVHGARSTQETKEI